MHSAPAGASVRLRAKCWCDCGACGALERDVAGEVRMPRRRPLAPDLRGVGGVRVRHPPFTIWGGHPPGAWGVWGGKGNHLTAKVRLCRGGWDGGWGGGGFWRLEMRLGAGVGVRECLWGRVSAVGGGGEGGGYSRPSSSDSLGGGPGGGYPPPLLPRGSGPPNPPPTPPPPRATGRIGRSTSQATALDAPSRRPPPPGPGHPHRRVRSAAAGRGPGHTPPRPPGPLRRPVLVVGPWVVGLVGVPVQRPGLDELWGVGVGPDVDPLRHVGGDGGVQGQQQRHEGPAVAAVAVHGGEGVVRAPAVAEPLQVPGVSVGDA